MANQLIQVLTQDHFGLARTKYGPAFILRMDSLRSDFFLCLFGEFVPRVSHQATDQAYASLKAVATPLRQRGVGCAVANLKLYPQIARLANQSQNQTHIASLPKIMMFGPNGSVIGVFSANVPKIPDQIIKFCLERLPKPVRSAGGSRRPTHYEDLEEEGDEDEEENREERGRRARSSSSRSAGYQPEFGAAPKMRGMIRGAVYDHDDGEEFLLPEEVTPHNRPWDAGVE